MNNNFDDSTLGRGQTSFGNDGSSYEIDNTSYGGGVVEDALVADMEHHPLYDKIKTTDFLHPDSTR